MCAISGGRLEGELPEIWLTKTIRGVLETVMPKALSQRSLEADNNGYGGRDGRTEEGEA